jgi:hypothetical protein
MRPCYVGRAGECSTVEWVPIKDGGFIAADVIRWKETIYGARRSSGAKALRVGERLVTAEVLNGPDRKGWVQLLVRKCEILTQFAVRKPYPLPTQTEIKRAAKTIKRGKPERLLWSDESARAVVASKLLNSS